MINTLLVMAGGAIGAALRYQYGRMSERVFGAGWPWGTLGVNIIGGLAMGLFVGWLAARSQASTYLGGESLRLFVAVGILGGFTTFSAFSLETIAMIQRGEGLSASLYVIVSVIASVGALALGLGFMRTVSA